MLSADSHLVPITSKMLLNNDKSDCNEDDTDSGKNILSSPTSTNKDILISYPPGSLHSTSLTIRVPSRSPTSKRIQGIRQYTNKKKLCQEDISTIPIVSSGSDNSLNSLNTDNPKCNVHIEIKLNHNSDLKNNVNSTPVTKTYLHKKKNCEQNNKIKNMRRYKCKCCDKTFAHQSSLYRHQKLCIQGAKISPVTCKLCNLVCSGPKYLKQHEKFCVIHNKEGPKYVVDANRNFVCKVCNRSYGLLKNYKKHIKNCIKKRKISKVTMSFKNMSEFYTWKLEEERKTFSYISKKSFSKAKNGIVYHYFHCKFRAYQDYRIRKTKRTRKIGRTPNYKCSAAMRVKESAGGVHVVYVNKHSHPLSFESVKYHRWFKDTREYIKSMISSGVPTDTIKKNLQPPDDGKDYPLRKEYFITTKQINQFKYSREMIKRLQRNDSISLKSRLKGTEDAANILLCKLQGEQTIVGIRSLDNLLYSDDIFIYGYQNSRQRQELINGSSRIVCLDSICKTNQYGFYLLNLVVPDEFGVGYPAAYFITSHVDIKILETIFETISTKCGLGHISAFMTDDDTSKIEAIRRVFGKNTKILLCKWHVIRSWRNHAISKIKYPILLKRVINDLHTLLELTDIYKFNVTLKSFYQKYENKCLKFVQHFRAYYGERAEMWAMCYRTTFHAHIHTKMLCEGLHKEIQMKTKRTTKTVSRRIDDLLSVLEELEYNKYIQLQKKREINDPTYVKNAIVSQHLKGMEIPDSSVKQMTDSSWVIASVESATKCIVECQSSTCDHSAFCLKCTNISCSGLCTNLYLCTCFENCHMCEHIHKVHSFRFKHDEELAAEYTVMNVQSEVEVSQDNTSHNTEVDVLQSSCRSYIERLNSLLSDKTLHSLLPYIDNSLKDIVIKVKDVVMSTPVQDQDYLKQSQSSEKQPFAETMRHEKGTEPFKFFEVSLENIGELRCPFIKIDNIVISRLDMKSLDSNLPHSEVSLLKAVSNNLFIRGWLYDTVIDGYLAAICLENENIGALQTYQVQLIANDHTERLLTNIPFHNKSVLLVPCNIDNNHWILTVVDIIQKNFLICDPQTLEITDSHFDIAQRLKRFLNLIMGYDEHLNWLITSPKRCQQKDGDSCGVLVCYYAHCISYNCELETICNTEEFRRIIFDTLMKHIIK